MAELTFTVDSALLSELGEKLVETAHIALVELVKNAYDADATQTTVKIIPNPVLEPHVIKNGRRVPKMVGKHVGPEVHVIDNGSGMTFRDVENYWMRIATTNKQDLTVSPRYGRPRTGKKGIGRFSCRRLGTQLRLITTAAIDGQFEQTEVLFEWLKFKPGKEISEITCKGERKRLKNATPGTTLIISGGPFDEWRKQGYDFLKRQLAVLTANRGKKRLHFEEDPGFNVTLEAPGFNEEIKDLRQSLLTAGWGDLNLHVKAGGIVACTLNAMKIGKKSVTHPQKFPDLASVSAKIGIMPTYSREEMRKTDVISKTSLQEIVDNWGGVYVRYKGFRVYPYGEPGNDWLNIDRDRGSRKTALAPILQPFAARLRGVNPQRALLSLLSSKSYIGDVEIGERASSSFEPKASREGFVGEAGIGQLREIVRFAIDWSTIYREYARGLAAKHEAEEARKELVVQLSEDVEPKEVVSTALRVVESEVRNLATRLPTSERQQVLRSLRTATQAIAKHDAASREELRHLQLVASTSTMLLIFSHEVKSLLSWFEQVKISLNRVKRSVNKPEAERLAEVVGEFSETKERLVDLLSMTSLISVNPKKADATELTLLPRLERAVRSFDLIKKNYDIDIDIDVPRTIQVGPMLEAELFSVLLNLLSNSIKSVIAAGGAKRIMVSAARRNSNVVINVRDSGVGLRKEHYEEVFVPFSADPENRLYSGLDARLNPEDEYIVGTGSGLGLSIVREILAYRAGTIGFIKPTGEWKADVEIVMP
ncbi:MAG TPA: sensor histidine kinase [Pyrinomonadaceae bacterium]|nr:sensor histidine kinase [Pyrinomonadaceae bacterium]